MPNIELAFFSFFASLLIQHAHAQPLHKLLSRSKQGQVRPLN